MKPCDLQKLTEGKSKHEVLVGNSLILEKDSDCTRPCGGGALSVSRPRLDEDREENRTFSIGEF